MILIGTAAYICMSSASALAQDERWLGLMNLTQCWATVGGLISGRPRVYILISKKAPQAIVWAAPEANYLQLLRRVSRG